MQPLRTAFGICFLSLLFSCPLFAADPVEGCNARLDLQIQSVQQKLRQLDDHFLHYRSAEIKIRELVYNKLWAARRESMDPFSKEKRKAGQNQEEFLLAELSVLEKESLDHSNGFSEVLLRIQESIPGWGKCCPERAFLDCAETSFQTVNMIVEDIRTEFDHLFEHEREFRKEVIATAGGREGLYPEDAVEVPIKHTDYYWRFEAEREPRRFLEDQKIRNFLHEIKKTLIWNSEGKKCCLECGKKS